MNPDRAAAGDGLDMGVGMLLPRGGSRASRRGRGRGARTALVRGTGGGGRCDWTVACVPPPQLGTGDSGGVQPVAAAAAAASGGPPPLWDRTVQCPCAAHGYPRSTPGLTCPLLHALPCRHMHWAGVRVWPLASAVRVCDPPLCRGCTPMSDPASCRRPVVGSLL
jgi:hypothetical protein